MTEIPKLTPEQAAILRASGLIPYAFGALIYLKDRGLIEWTDSATALGRAALANYEDEREREIRIKTLLECESAAKAVVDVWRTRGANAVAWAITDLVHAELEKRKVTP